MCERIPADSWFTHVGHVRQYWFSMLQVRPGERVNDVACGVGYGSLFFPKADYLGYDKPGVPDAVFPGPFAEADIDDRSWRPRDCDVSVTLGSLEHFRDPAEVARKLRETTARAIVVSVPTQPTMDANHFHLHDFTYDEVPLLFPHWTVAAVWDHPEELSHVWVFDGPA
jgi:hypothetical protein